MASNLLARAQRAQALRDPSLGSSIMAEKLPAVAVAPGVSALSIEGTIGASRIAGLDAPFAFVLEILEADPGGLGLILDCSILESVDAAGAGFLAAWHKRYRARGRELVVAGLHPLCVDFLRILGFEGFFTVAADVPQAIDYFRNVARMVASPGARCPACGSQVAVPAPGRRRCRACKAVLTAAPDGSLSLG